MNFESYLLSQHGREVNFNVYKSMTILHTLSAEKDHDFSVKALEQLPNGPHNEIVFSTMLLMFTFGNTANVRNALFNL